MKIPDCPVVKITDLIPLGCRDFEPTFDHTRTACLKLEDLLILGHLLDTQALDSAISHLWTL